MTEEEVRVLAREAVARRHAEWHSALPEDVRKRVDETIARQIEAEVASVKEEFRAQAREAAIAAYNEPETMFYATPVKDQDRLVWYVHSGYRGAGLHVTIDDATGEVVEIRWVGTR